MKQAPANPDERRNILKKIFYALRQSPMFSHYSVKHIRDSAIKSEQLTFDRSQSRQEYLQAMHAKLVKIEKSYVMNSEEILREIHRKDKDGMNSVNGADSVGGGSSGSAVTVGGLNGIGMGGISIGMGGPNSILTQPGLSQPLVKPPALNQPSLTQSNLTQSKPADLNGGIRAGVAGGMVSGRGSGSNGLGLGEDQSNSEYTMKMVNLAGNGSGGGGIRRALPLDGARLGPIQHISLVSPLNGGRDNSRESGVSPEVFGRGALRQNGGVSGSAPTGFMSTPLLNRVSIGVGLDGMNGAKEIGGGLGGVEFARGPEQGPATRNGVFGGFSPLTKMGVADLEGMNRSGARSELEKPGSMPGLGLGSKLGMVGGGLPRTGSAGSTNTITKMNMNRHQVASRSAQSSSADLSLANGAGSEVPADVIKRVESTPSQKTEKDRNQSVSWLAPIWKEIEEMKSVVEAHKKMFPRWEAERKVLQELEGTLREKADAGGEHAADAVHGILQQMKRQVILLATKIKQTQSLSFRKRLARISNAFIQKKQTHPDYCFHGADRVITGDSPEPMLTQTE
ncbi:hypothetical protein NEHOM01_1797 [Nematocida homosporus]|uniref:uncharacterized protein n=1 Tax=Nematocida homosporus TaxID=1912981 RepID=UPI002220BC16|nr:uncharacterized protein NEHOM01_1797 [Nematocida homosporus]KAI5186913.1 hypothetical protein NEHOM01_1797 [Nematocida homosporus]